MYQYVSDTQSSNKKDCEHAGKKIMVPLKERKNGWSSSSTKSYRESGSTENRTEKNSVEVWS